MSIQFSGDPILSVHHLRQKARDQKTMITSQEITKYAKNTNEMQGSGVTIELKPDQKYTAVAEL